MSDVELIRGGVAADDRGVLMFVNDLDLSNYRRFMLSETIRRALFAPGMAIATSRRLLWS